MTNPQPQPSKDMNDKLDNLTAQIHFKEHSIPSVHAGKLTDKSKREIKAILNQQEPPMTNNSDELRDAIFEHIGEIVCGYNAGGNFPSIKANKKEMDEIMHLIHQSQLALLERVLVEIIGDDANLSVASRGKERDAKTFNSKFYIRKAAQNALRAEQRQAIHSIKATLKGGTDE